MTAAQTPMPSVRPRVIVVGGGFGGLRVVKRLRRLPADVEVLDRHNYHLFQPLLYQVASAVLSPAEIAYPIRRIFRRQQNVSVHLAEVRGVDLTRQVVVLSDGAEHAFDYLVLAAGATHSYFGHDEWAASAPGLKTIDDALEIRRRVLMAFEQAEHEADDDARRAMLSFVVVGGGPTGVELAGALKEIAVQSIPRDFRNVDTTTARVILVEANDRLLAAMPAPCSERARRSLQRMGVEVRLQSKVTQVSAQGVRIGDEFIAAANVLWAAGVTASPIARSLAVELDRAGRVIVERDLSVPGHPNVFVIGDMAHVKDIKRGGAVPGLAPAAMQMGDFVGKLLDHEIRDMRSRDDRPAFRYRDKGTLATIGRARAVAHIAGMNFSGVFAWLLWSVVHITFLIGFRSKLFVMLGWAWNYIMFSRGARLITGERGGEQQC